ncbi:ATP-dependent DNA helicase RecG [Oceanospirillum multiglobuliferum]|uniref:ATP-dependent DNA helicase RecG n=1 Tax=Oceanospirillum multiglobuliferum TaxID=64969 RepID=A0A1T4NV30_9GAMM|nr:ATP-dependent DNA helicase RecG [Oceanospirillum multiglobuliferum]OPX55657.1 ATP-dependent DNA helicase RecG [Oceanospirillum multiglobuliferum]SJZ83025.1 ATP-dependent DNA helicase RecG [Oceanospirillum multiglobuliferum]
MSALTDASLQKPVTELKGVGAALAAKLDKLGISSIEDLLFHLPARYQDRTRVTPIGAIRRGDEVVVVGQVMLADVVKGQRRALIVRLQDGTGSISLRFFHFNAAQQNQFKNGLWVRCYGEARPGANGLELYHPEYRIVKPDQPLTVEDYLTPVYPLAEGLTQNRMRQLIDLALAQLKNTTVTDWLPSALFPHLPSLKDSLLLLHQPPPDAPVYELQEYKHPSQHRLIMEELIAQQLSLLKLRQQHQAHLAPIFQVSGSLQQQLLDQLPFPLTGAQGRVISEIQRDMALAKPMLRLVQGDVGAGKTLVAAVAALTAIEAGYQVAVMAPTEILAEQHFNNFTQWLTPLGLETAWLAGKLKGKARQKQLDQIANGAAMVVGTHALFQEQVQFQRLGLAIIDEQHRFGVHQRLSLREKGRMGDQYPHQLIMTATPIPRTLAMSAYADLDTSIIDELPPGRTPIETVALADSRRDEVIQRIAHACQQGKQAYWVCTLIEDSETLQCQAAETTFADLQLRLKELQIGLVHGRMKPKEKADIMAQFKANKLQLLVATTVIEVGVDVPNATMMVIENPERLGLSQLHQLRGRVGRGAQQSYCVLLYHTPLSRNGKARISVMRETQDGFCIAEKDLELRGPGEVLGTKQTGLAQMKIADLVRDQYLLEMVNQAANKLIQHYPEHLEPIVERWLGGAEQYAQV